ncbi:MAG: hypothetical protein V1738_00205 [Patescibacteria group bacterium]
MVRYERRDQGFNSWSANSSEPTFISEDNGIRWDAEYRRMQCGQADEPMTSRELAANGLLSGHEIFERICAVEDYLIARIDGDDNDDCDVCDPPNDENYLANDYLGDVLENIQRYREHPEERVDVIIPTDWDENAPSYGSMHATSDEWHDRFFYRTDSTSWHRTTRARRQFARRFGRTQRSATESIRDVTELDSTDLEFCEVENRFEPTDDQIPDVDVWAPDFIALIERAIIRAVEQQVWEAQMEAMSNRLQRLAHRRRFEKQDADEPNVPVVIGSRKAVCIGFDGNLASCTYKSGQNYGADTSWKRTTRAPRQWAARAA